MSRTCRIIAAAALLSVFILPPFSAKALSPQDALSGRPEKSFYVTLRVDDLGGIARDLLSPANLELLASLVDPSDAQALRLVGSYASRIPAKSVALAAGAAVNGANANGANANGANANRANAQPEFFFQIAVSLPEELQPKLALVAEGKAEAADLTALVLGDDSPLLSSAIADTAVRQGKHGPYYAREGAPAVVSAKDGLLLLASSPEDLDASKEALEKADKRLAFKRRFKSPNYCALHIDVPTVRQLAEKRGKDDKDDKNSEYLWKLFTGTPLEMELAFDSNPGSFLVSLGANVLESFAAAEDYKKLKPLEGGGLFFAGGGRPYFGLGSLMNFSPEQLAAFPEALAGWSALAGELAKAGISVEDVTNLLGGSVSLVASGKAAFFGQAMPEISLAFTGRNGAADRLLKSLLENEKFTASVPLSPLKMQGWDMLFQVDPAILQTSLFVGVKGETLLLGVLDPKEIGKKPAFSPQIAELLEKDSFSTAFLDVPALWEHLRFAALDKNSPFAKEVSAHPQMREVLEGELPVGLIKAWTPTVETSFLEFQTVDVAPEKRVFSKLLAAAKTAFGADGKKDEKGEADEDIASFPFGSEQSQPLILLMVAKGAIEEALEDEPGADLNDLREDFSDFAVILETESGEIYVGTQVAGEEKTALREQAEPFGLLGSAGLTLAPDGTPYSGQEAAWLKIDRDR